MHVRFGIVTIVRPLFFLFVLFLWTSILTRQIETYSENNSLLFLVMIVGYGESFIIDFGVLYFSIAFYMVRAAMLTLLLSLFISPIVFDCRDIATIVSWQEQETSVGKYMVQQRCQNKRKTSDKRNRKNLLSENLSTRLMYLINSHFWKYMFNHFIFSLPQVYRRFVVVKASVYLLKLPVVLICFPFLTLPIFTICLGFIHNARQGIFCHCLCSKCQTEDESQAEEEQCEMMPTTVEHLEENSSLGNREDNEEPCRFSLGRNDIVVDEVDKKGKIKKTRTRK